MKEQMRLLKKSVKNHWQIYLLVLLPVMWMVIFVYFPMYGVQIAFRDFKPYQGITGSEWVGLAEFRDLLNSPQFWKIFKNTITITFLNLILAFPSWIILALIINEIGKKSVKKTVQTLTFAPHFISTVVIVGMLNVLLYPGYSLLSTICAFFNVEVPNILASSDAFPLLYVLSEIWQHAGFSAVIFIAALSNIDSELIDATRIDGASRLQKIWHLDIPTIKPTMITLFILEVGNIMNLGFEKIYLMQNPLNLAASETISTYVYKIGLLQANYSTGTAVSLFNGVINLLLLVTVNLIVKKMGEEALW